jgi:hypothetical protein
MDDREIADGIILSVSAGVIVWLLVFALLEVFA